MVRIGSPFETFGGLGHLLFVGEVASSCSSLGYMLNETSRPHCLSRLLGGPLHGEA